MLKNNSESKSKAAVLGANFNGLVASCYLAKAGYKVEIFEEAKDVYQANNIFKTKDFKFEFCANWYFLPEIIKNFWTDFDKNSKDTYQTEKLNPGYKVFFEKQDFEVRDLTDTKLLFSKLEPGSGVELEKLLRRASLFHKNYLNSHGYKPLHINKLYKLLQAKLYNSQMNKQINNQDIICILKTIPRLVFGGLYKLPNQSLMFNFADFGRGHVYPANGYEAVVDELVELAKNLKVKLNFNQNIQTLGVKTGSVKSIKINNKRHKFDLIISCLEQGETIQLLPKNHQNDWSDINKKLSQTKLVKFAFGLDCKTENLQHHNVFYDCDWADYNKSFKKDLIPNEPPFFVDCPSKTDKTTCNEQNEVLVVSAYLPAILETTDEQIAELKNQIIKRISEKVLFDIEKHIVSEQTHQTIIQNSLYLNQNTIETKIDNLYHINPQTNPEINFAQAITQAKILAMECEPYGQDGSLDAKRGNSL